MKVLKVQRKLPTDIAKDLEMLLCELTGEANIKVSYQSTQKGWPTEIISSWMRSVQGSLCPHSWTARHYSTSVSKAVLPGLTGSLLNTSTSSWL